MRRLGRGEVRFEGVGTLKMYVKNVVFAGICFWHFVADGWDIIS
jgi:hypothetical protein